MESRGGTGAWRLIYLLLAADAIRRFCRETVFFLVVSVDHVVLFILYLDFILVIFDSSCT